METNTNLNKDEVEKFINELMVGEKGQKKMREKAKLAEEAITAPSGSSYNNLEKFINNVLLHNNNSQCFVLLCFFFFPRKLPLCKKNNHNNMKV